MIEKTIKTEHDKKFCITKIKSLTEDGQDMVIFKKAPKDSTGRQRNLKWRWNRDIAMSGIGSADNENDVHCINKWLFARPILLEDDDVFGEIYNYFMKVVDKDVSKKEKIKMFTEQYISTERLSKDRQREYLRNLQKYWLDKGVNLTDPEEYSVKKDSRGLVK